MKPMNPAHWMPTLLVVGLLVAPNAQAGSLDVPSSDWGISIGNSTRFSGLRLNFRDHGVDEINGVNLDL